MMRVFNHSAALRAMLLAVCISFTVWPATAAAQSVQIDGVVVARYDAALALPVSGMLKEIAIDVGDRVEAGQTLATLDDTCARLVAELARLTEEQTPMAAEAEPRATRGRESKESRGTDASDAGHTSTASRTAAHQRAHLEHQLAEARLAQHTLTAPVAGIVERIYLSPGQFVGAGQPILRLIQLDRPWIEAHIPSDLAGALEMGDTVTIQLRTAPAARSSGEADQAADPTSDPITATLTYLSGVIDPQTDACFARFTPAAESNTPPLRIGAHVSIALPDRGATTLTSSP